MSMYHDDDDEEHQLGRISLSGDRNEVEFIETDDSEANDLSDDENQVIRTGNRNVRRVSSLQDGNRGRTLPSRIANLSGDSAFSKRFRRTVSANTNALASRTSTNLWSTRDGDDVDQSVNLMDLSQSNPGTSRFSRPGMSSLRQKSLVDIFLTDDTTETNHRGGKSDFNRSNNGQRKYRTCRNWVLVVGVILVSILFIVVMPDFGLVSTKRKNAKKNAPEPTKAPTALPTKSPTGAPTKKPEEVIEEQAEVDLATPEEVSEPEEEEETTEEDAAEGEVEEEEGDIPQSRPEALKYSLVYLGITQEEQLETTDSPAQKAMNWIADEDPAKLPIPGLLEAENNDLEADYAVLQRYALAVFYYSVQEKSSTNEARDAGRELQTEMALANRESFDQGWLTAKSICKWHGVVCDEDDKSVVEINLPDHLLQGTLPRELLVGQAMPSLKLLNLAKNSLGGSFPELGDTPSSSVLEELNLDDNHFTGSLDNLMGLSKLREISLGDNRLTGTLPVEDLGALTALTILKLHSNDLAGSLPDKLHPLIRLQEVVLSGNEFSGSVPESLGELMNLKLLFLDGNQFVGQVPSSLGHLLVLQKLRLDGNQVTGTMPAEICALRDRKLLALESDCASDQFSCDCCTECW